MGLFSFIGKAIDTTTSVVKLPITVVEDVSDSIGLVDKKPKSKTTTEQLEEIKDNASDTWDELWD